VTLLELTAAYSAFANEGVVAEPRLILRVEDASGAAIWHASERRTQAITPTTAYLMSSMLSDVVASGTAAGAEKVPICRLSGARAGARCRHAVVDDGGADPPAGVLDPSLVSIDVPPPEPAVYEDLFPRGAIPSDTCPLHEPAAGAATPLVDAAMAPSSRGQVSAPGPAIRDVSTRLFVDRVSTGTGAYATVMRPQ
jgi:hypothetical protein